MFELIFVDWKKGFIVRLFKNGNFIKCGNWRGVVVKVMGKVLI